MALSSQGSSRGKLAAWLRQAVVTVVAIAAVIFVWDMLIVALRIPPYLVPKPMAVLESFIENRHTIATQTAFTLSAAGLGLLVSTVLATVLAVIFVLNRNIADAALPVVITFRSMPVTAIAPIMMLVLGRGIGTSMAVVSIVSFFPLLVNLTRGLSIPDRNTQELLSVYSASRWQELRYMRIPFALPFLFTGLRVAGASAILGAMLSEWITGSRGLGNLILDSGEMREIELLWAAVLTSVAAGLCVFWLTSAGERRVLHWRR
jgi:ABC-type nitrate/sulfonate/bicarbonate transport system permease component